MERRSSRPEIAVYVEGAFKSYGRGSGKVEVLQNLHMSVPKNNIYGLLGPSGSGKTTLLRCILGRLQLDQGQVLTLGRSPGSRGHQVPGRSVGYMPQELALFMEFSIGDTLRYFGHLMRMTSADVAERTAFLIQFLNLPERTRLIKQLSGGQQRRTSFAVALLQQPPLLILDEPTVGVDPLLRQRIWEHLLEIAEFGDTTIIITTHYIEEARQANMVGLMRQGRILAEANPELLVQRYEEQTLEDVFLKLCEEDFDIDEEEATHVTRRAKKRTASDVTYNEEEEALLDDKSSSRTSDAHRASPASSAPPVPTPAEKPRTHLCDCLPSIRNIFALVMKNLHILRRNFGMLLFQFFIPSIQIILFCICIGQQPYHLTMAVVNNETGPSLPVPPMGNTFLSFISNKTVVQERFATHDGAIAAVRGGDAWGVIELGANYTRDLLMRFTSKSELDNATIAGGSVHLYLDTTNQQIFFTLQAEILRAFTAFATETLERFYPELHINPGVAQVPIIMEPPVYGSLNSRFLDFMAPGIILSITFFMATGLTAVAFVLDRKQGLLDRSFVAGVTAVEVMTAHVWTQLLVMLVQVALLLVFALAVFKVPYEGPLVLVILLTLFQGFTGMALGLLISSVCKEEHPAIQCALASVYPNMILSGIIWPLEAMPVWMRYLGYCLPNTYAAQAMRSILARGWGLTSPGVWQGFLMSIGWGWAMMALAAVIFKFRG